MANYYTSDLHIEHKRITEYTDRSLVVSQEDHTDWVIDLINSTVKPGDTLFNLGDFVFSKDPKEIVEIIERINCHVVCIKGNHDSNTTWKKVKTNKVISFQDYKEMKLKDGQHLCMFHFPMHVWHRQHYGSYHAHGHTHGSYQGQGRILDVGLDNSLNVFGEYKLFTEDDIIQFMSGREVISNDGHKVRITENHD